MRLYHCDRVPESRIRCPRHATPSLEPVADVYDCRLPGNESLRPRMSSMLLECQAGPKMTRVLSQERRDRILVRGIGWLRCIDLVGSIPIAAPL
jgi:hypothetical protein